MGQKHEQLHISILIISLLLASTLAGCIGQKETNGVVAILTDFGAQDYYVGAIKGTVLATYSQAQVMVTTAEIPAFDVHQAAVTLLFTAQEFPSGTVFLAIVDPGGGAEQRAIAMKTANGQFFVAPDNGLLTLVEQEPQPSTPSPTPNGYSHRDATSSSPGGTSTHRLPPILPLASPSPMQARQWMILSTWPSNLPVRRGAG
jgi:hypothetical protein